jgi:hypothetical protein
MVLRSAQRSLIPGASDLLQKPALNRANEGHLPCDGSIERKCFFTFVSPDKLKQSFGWAQR